MPDNENDKSSGHQPSPAAQAKEAELRKTFDDLVDMDYVQKAAPSSPQTSTADVASAGPPAPAPTAPEPLSAQAAATIADSLMAEPDSDLQAVTESAATSAGDLSAEVARTASRRRMIFAIVSVLLLVSAAAAFAFLALRGGSTAGSAAAPAAGTGQALGGAAASGAAGTAGAGAGGCLVPASAVTLANEVTYKDRGVNDPRMFVVQWSTQATNNSSEPILATAHWSSSDGAGRTGWEGSYLSLAPGASQSWSGYVDNNAGGIAGALNWSYVDRVVAVHDSPDCAQQLTAPTGAVESGALQTTLPELPAGNVLPTP